MNEGFPSSSSPVSAYLAPQDEHGVDVGEDAVEAEVDMRTHQGEDRREVTGPWLELESTAQNRLSKEKRARSVRRAEPGN